MEEIYKNLDLNGIEGEIWLPIEGYENYQVSNMGRVKSLKDNNGKYREKILRQGKNNKGYLYVILYKNGKGKACTVHRLVGNAFLDNPNGYRCFNHKNEIKTDNRAENLEPCTHKYNTNYGTCQQRRVASTDWKSVGRKVAEKLTNRQDQSKKVYQYSKDYELVKIWNSTQQCGRNGYNEGNVASCCRGERKSHRDFIWSYTEINQK